MLRKGWALVLRGGLGTPAMRGYQEKMRKEPEIRLEPERLANKSTDKCADYHSMQRYWHKNRKQMDPSSANSFLQKVAEDCDDRLACGLRTGATLHRGLTLDVLYKLLASLKMCKQPQEIANLLDAVASQGIDPDLGRSTEILSRLDSALAENYATSPSEVIETALTTFVSIKYKPTKLLAKIKSERKTLMPVTNMHLNSCAYCLCELDALDPLQYKSLYDRLETGISRGNLAATLDGLILCARIRDSPLVNDAKVKEQNETLIPLFFAHLQRTFS
jgi:hypothetical protein